MAGKREIVIPIYAHTGAAEILDIFEALKSIGLDDFYLREKRKPEPKA